MGNAQKKLGRKRKKDTAGKRQSTSKSTESDDNGIEDLLSKGPIQNFYEVNTNAVLGRGHYAVVNLGMCKKTRLHVAVKRIQISKSRIEALQREVQVLRKIGQHPNIVSLLDIFVTNTELQLVLELLRGGELFDRMVEKGPYSEREAAHHIRKIGLALQFLHKNGIVHRDLKPENLILTDKSDEAELKIADFGLSKIVDDVASSTMQTVCGTWAYCAPEVKTSVTRSSNNQNVASYTAAVDLWSVGVILFVILGAYHPFDPDGDASDVQLWERICSGVFNFNDPAWENISDLAKDLIQRLIVVDPSKRYTTDQLLAHPWINLGAEVPSTPITPSIDKSLGGFITNRRAITPRSALGMNYNQQQNLDMQYQQQDAYQYANTNQHPMNNFNSPPHPQFGIEKDAAMNYTQAQESQPHTQVQFAPQVTFQESVEIHNQYQPQQHNQNQPMQQNPGLTLDTGVSYESNTQVEKMEISTPSFSK